MKDVGSTLVQSRSVVGSKVAKAAQVHSLKELIGYTKPFVLSFWKQWVSLFFPFFFSKSWLETDDNSALL